ncbi:SMP-30/gluconolactonase/LRE family protein [Flagellimonas crocea]|uniref:SMP-30/gluconolactonase/LRE family protein n=1 Tax=Flagellimonas crocea TaxID=3067311 RepID=UPI00296F1919|nr:SMP-30/gluconolactonase/LRE family protein [Muricauda sp. DH64]
MKRIHTIKKTLWALGLLIMVYSCKSEPRPDWAEVNQEVISEYQVEGRTRDDVPNTGIQSNLEDAQVTNLDNLKEVTLEIGVTAKVYWGMGALMELVDMEPGTRMPVRNVEGDRFLFVLEGEVEELIDGDPHILKSRERAEPGAIKSASPIHEFVYLQGGQSSIKAGSQGAKILEVFSPVPPFYLEMMGYPKDIPEPVSIDGFPVEPNVEPGVVMNLDELQYTELVPGANSRIISGRGVQMSFLRMNPNTTFARHIHPEEQTMLAFRGWIDEIILDTIVKMQKDDLVNLPPNLVHGGNLGPYGCDALDVFFPPRTDYDQKSVDRLEGYHRIVPRGAKAKLLIDGSKTQPTLVFTEGPAWQDGKLYFSNMFFDEDFNGNPNRSSLVEMDVDGSYHNIVENKMQTNGIAPMGDGTLAVCDMFGHRVLQMDTNGNILKVLADQYDGKPLDGPNDLVIDSKGGIYFTDPQFTGDAVKNQPGRSAYYRNPQGEVIRLLEPDSYAMPNGIALSPDGNTLYINNTFDDREGWDVNSDKENFVWAYDVQADGTITNERKFAELYLIGHILDKQEKSSGADGMKVDAEGNLYIATYAGVQIFNDQGEFQGIIYVPDYPVNLTFGGPNGKTMYITTHDKIYSIETNVGI